MAPGDVLETRSSGSSPIPRIVTHSDALDPHAHEAHVRAIAVTGTGMRDAEALAALGRRTGWMHERNIPLGWGVQAMVLHGAH